MGFHARASLETRCKIKVVVLLAMLGIAEGRRVYSNLHLYNTYRQDADVHSRQEARGADDTAVESVEVGQTRNKEHADISARPVAKLLLLKNPKLSFSIAMKPLLHSRTHPPCTTRSRRLVMTDDEDRAKKEDLDNLIAALEKRKLEDMKDDFLRQGGQKLLGITTKKDSPSPIPMKDSAEESAGVEDAKEDAAEDSAGVEDAIEDAAEESAGGKGAIEDAAEESAGVKDAIEDAAEESAGVKDATADAEEESAGLENAIADAAEGLAGVEDEVRLSEEPPATVAEESKSSEELQAIQTEESKSKVASGLIPGRVLPAGDKFDKKLLGQAGPTCLNLLTGNALQGALDLKFINLLGNSLVNNGLSAGDQVFNTLGLFTVSFPAVVVTSVSMALAAGHEDEAQRQVGGALFISAIIGALITGVIIAAPKGLLKQLLGLRENVMAFAVPYLLWRVGGIIPKQITDLSLAALRGSQDVASPLKVSVLELAMNAILNYIFILHLRMGIAGAALATALAQTVSSAASFGLLLRRKLVTLRGALRPPSLKLMKKFGSSLGYLWVRVVALNLSFLALTKRVLSLDATGITGAAHAAAVQVWLLGGVLLFALSITTNAVTSRVIGTPGTTPDEARAVAKRLLTWGAIVGGTLAVLQTTLAGPLIAAFAPRLDVQQVARAPYLIGAYLQIMNGPIYVGEGLMQAGGALKALMIGQIVSTSLFYMALKVAPQTLISFWKCLGVLMFARFLNVANFFWFSKSPLRPEGRPYPWSWLGRQNKKKVA